MLFDLLALPVGLPPASSPRTCSGGEEQRLPQLLERESFISSGTGRLGSLLPTQYVPLLKLGHWLSFKGKEQGTKLEEKRALHMERRPAQGHIRAKVPRRRCRS